MLEGKDMFSLGMWVLPIFSPSRLAESLNRECGGKKYPILMKFLTGLQS